MTSPLAQQPRPQFPPMLEMSLPQNKIVDIQSQWIRDLEIPPEDYFPEGYHPELLGMDWTLKEVITIPMPESMQHPKYKKQEVATAT